MTTSLEEWKLQGNGKIPLSALTSLSWQSDQHLHPDAAAALERLNVAYRARFTADISVTDSYRTYAEQVAVREKKGNLAAVPGTSNHGWALAVDLGGGINTDYTTDQYRWMSDNAPAYGWVNPAWAKPGPGFQKREPWHWEFTGSLTEPTIPEPEPVPDPYTTTEDDMTYYEALNNSSGGYVKAGRMYKQTGDGTFVGLTNLEGDGVVRRLVTEGKLRLLQFNGNDLELLMAVHGVAEQPDLPANAPFTSMKHPDGQPMRLAGPGARTGRVIFPGTGDFHYPYVTTK